MLGSNVRDFQRIQRDDYQAEFRDVGSVQLDLRQEDGRKAIAQLLELLVARAYEQSPSYWRLKPIRQWYGDKQIASAEGVDVISRMAFATVVLGDTVGITFDPGYFIGPARL